jgi:acetylornithine deacetylase/succinyl-diaminopimelate desuccinylase-like protein
MDHIQVLKDLISIDTSVPPGLNYGRTIDYLEPLFGEVGLSTERVAIPEEYADGKVGRVNLVAHRRTSPVRFPRESMAPGSWRYGKLFSLI